MRPWALPSRQQQTIRVPSNEAISSIWGFSFACCRTIPFGSDIVFFLPGSDARLGAGAQNPQEHPTRIATEAVVADIPSFFH